MSPLRIYLADLTHDTVGLATEVFPLNIGFVAAYCKKQFGDSVELKLFKYITHLEAELTDNPPDVLALSNYPWCHKINLAVLDLLAKRRPEALRYMGGPNFPHEPELQEQFLAARPVIDSHAYLDGETGFSNFIRYVLDAGSLKNARDGLKEKAIVGSRHLDKHGHVQPEVVPVRVADLDQIPSPYLTGLMDPFFDGRLSPMIQTNRGCPFSCTFCADGNKVVNKINHFSIDRIKAELAYIVERVPKKVKSLFISDLNYGMYKRDAEISEEIARLKTIHDYPYYIDVTTGKNSKHRVIKSIEKLSGALSLTMSVQSLTPVVLQYVKRDNMRLDDFLGLKPALKRSGLPTNSEVILGLPGETKESHIGSLCQLIDAGIDNVFAYTLMLLNGTELNTPEQRRMWGYETRFRVIPRDFTRLRDGRNVVEVEEVVIASNTLLFEDYVECRKFVLLMNVTNNIGFSALMRFLRANNVPAKDFFVGLLNSMNSAPATGHPLYAPPGLLEFVREFERETREELWESEDELIAFFQVPENFQGLLEGRYGANLLQTYKAKIWAHAFAELADAAFAHTGRLMHQRGAPPDVIEQLAQVERFCRATTYDLLGDDRLEVVPTARLRYDIPAWLSSADSEPLASFRHETERTHRFTLTRKQYDLVEDALERFGRTDLGKGKVLIRISLNTLWRSAHSGETVPAAAGQLNSPLRFYEVPTSVVYRV